MSNEEKWREDKYRDEFEDELGGVYGLGRFSRMDDGYEAEKLNILWRGYRVGRQHSEKEIEELRSEKGLTGIIKASVNFASKNIELQKELEKYKEAYLVLKQGLAEADQSLTCSVNVGKIITEASKRAALILGEGE